MLTLELQLMNIVEKRLNENYKSFNILFNMKHYGNCISIMCQELDQYMKLLYLIKQPHDVRRMLIENSINNKKWNMVDHDIEVFIQGLTGWEADISKFRNIFYNITVNMNYLLRDPISGLNEDERDVLFKYIKEYHNQSILKDYTIKELVLILPEIFQRISDNIKGYFKDGRLS